MHAAQDHIIDVLDGQIQVLADVGGVRDHVQQTLVGLIGVAVEDAQPVHAVDGGGLAHQLGQGGMLLPVRAVAGGILGHQDVLTHALPGKLTHFTQDGVLAAGAVMAADQRDGAEGAAVVAAVADAGVGGVGGGGQHPVMLEEVEALGTQAVALMRAHRRVDGVGQLIVLVHAHQQVNLGNFLQEGLLVPLGQAARHHQQPAAAGLFVAGHLQDGVDGLLLGGLNEAAGIHHQHVSLGGVAGEAEATGFEQAQGGFGVHAVLVAAQGDHADQSLFRHGSFLSVVGYR